MRGLTQLKKLLLLFQSQSGRECTSPTRWTACVKALCTRVYLRGWKKSLAASWWCKTRGAGYRLALQKACEVIGDFWCKVFVSFT